MSYRQYPPEYYEPSSRGPCQVCKVDEEDHGCGHVWIAPCGQLEGLDKCWFCAEPKAYHSKHEYEPPEPVRDDA